MSHQPTITVAVKTDTSQLARTARIVAKHLAALADELEAPDGIITIPDDAVHWTAERDPSMAGSALVAACGSDGQTLTMDPAKVTCMACKTPALIRHKPPLCGQPTQLGSYRNPCTRPAGHDPSLGHQVI